ncbi:signal peptidase I [Candidatus Kaiserbacteria bacterium]|nr:signal peptidase I [Candidatus Kaiserbacteria bacterium]
MKIIYNIIYAVFIVLLLGVAGLFLGPLLPIENNIQLKIVESGSMEPNIMTGALVVIKPTNDYKVGDVITFSGTFSDTPTTHRISEIITERGQQTFITKGDANEEVDTNGVARRNIIGKVILDIPRVGYILDFTRQPIGFGLLIVLPAIMIILGEIEKIWLEVRRVRRGVSATENNPASNNKEPKIPQTVRPAKSLTEPLVVAPFVSKRPPSHSSVVYQKSYMMDIGNPVRYQANHVVSEKRVLKQKSTTGIQTTKIKKESIFSNQWALPLITLLVSTSLIALSFVGSTVSYLNDFEISEDNQFMAVALDFIASVNNSNYNFGANNLLTENNDLITVVLPEGESVDVLYKLKVEFVTGNINLCDAVLVKTDDPIDYSGSIMGLAADGVEFDSAWNMAIKLDETASGFTGGDICVVDMVYQAWDKTGDSETGYSDEERVKLYFNTPVSAGATLLSDSDKPSFSAQIIDESVEKIVEPELETNEGESVEEDDHEIDDTDGLPKEEGDTETLEVKAESVLLTEEIKETVESVETEEEEQEQGEESEDEALGEGDEETIDDSVIE